MADERYGPLVRVPELVGKLDDVTALRVRTLAEDPFATPEEIRAAHGQIVAERRQARAAERTRRVAAVAKLEADVAAAAVNSAMRGA
ncbi:MAG TPA: hypothetical protein VK547_09705 [Candidatus Udaeobacter sp.]|nr:hypothetical protein [Candidatus Udaeobacter sp.]